MKHKHTRSAHSNICSLFEGRMWSMYSTEVINCKQCSKLSFRQDLTNEDCRCKIICSQRRTHYTHLKKIKKNKRSQLGNAALLDVRGSWGFFWFFLDLFLGEQILDLLQPMVGREPKKCSIWLFGIWCWKWQKHIFIKYNINNIIISENYISPLIGAFSFFFPLFLLLIALTVLQIKLDSRCLIAIRNNLEKVFLKKKKANKQKNIMIKVIGWGSLLFTAFKQCSSCCLDFHLTEQTPPYWQVHTNPFRNVSAPMRHINTILAFDKSFLKKSKKYWNVITWCFTWHQNMETHFKLYTAVLAKRPEPPVECIFIINDSLLSLHFFF